MVKTALWLLGQVVRAILFTVVLSALFHLALVFYDYISTGNAAYINPVSFLGIGTVAPQYTNSTGAIAVGWIVLVSIGTVIFFYRARVFIKSQMVILRRRYRASLFMIIFRAMILTGSKSSFR